jgi:hypothetical protein
MIGKRTKQSSEILLLVVLRTETFSNRCTCTNRLVLKYFYRSGGGGNSFTRWAPRCRCAHARADASDENRLRCSCRFPIPVLIITPAERWYVRALAWTFSRLAVTMCIGGSITLSVCAAGCVRHVIYYPTHYYYYYFKYMWMGRAQNLETHVFFEYTYKRYKHSARARTNVQD